MDKIVSDAGPGVDVRTPQGSSDADERSPNVVEQRSAIEIRKRTGHSLAWGAEHKVITKKKSDFRKKHTSKTKLPNATGDAFARVIFGLCLACLVWIAITTFAPFPVGLLRNDGWICPRATVCAEDWYSLALLAISRSSAYGCYPLMILLFLTKANNLRTFLQRTPLSILVPFYDLHQIHTLAGSIVGFGMIIHGTCHMIRWALQGNISFLWEHQTGITGSIAFVITPLICWPMMYPRFKTSMTWEWRKGLHYLSILWGICAMFHAPQMHIVYLIGIPVIVYLLDFAFGVLARSYYIETSTFRRLDGGVELTFEHPEGFTTDGAGFVMVCVPWVSKYQWHAFSLFAHPTKPNHSCVCMCMNGDWTRDLHDAVMHPTKRPVWIAGPQASPYATAVKYDNLILCASGVGITPAMSIITRHKASRCINLIWMCREPSLLEYYLQTCNFDDEAWTLIFYTGKRKLVLDSMPENVLILAGRPQLEQTIMEIVTHIELGAGLPESVMTRAVKQRREITELAQEFSLGDGEAAVDVHRKFSILLCRRLEMYSYEELSDIIMNQDAGPAGDDFDFNEVLEDLFPEAFSTSEMEDLAKRIDSNSDGSVDLGEFQKACFTALKTMKKKYDGERYLLASASTLEADALESAFKEVPVERLATWQLLYCGGAQPVEDALSEISKKYHIKFKSEKFDW